MCCFPYGLSWGLFTQGSKETKRSANTENAVTTMTDGLNSRSSGMRATDRQRNSVQRTLQEEQ